MRSDGTRIIKLGFTNCFLLRSSEGYLMIDTSYHHKYEPFLRKLMQANIDISDIKHLILTHHHDDHAGFANKLLENSEARLIVHRNALPFLQRGRHHKKGKPLNWCVGIVLALFSFFHKYSYPPVNVRKDDILIEGNTSKPLRKIGIDGKILHTPWHSTDSISVVLANGDAFVGDVAMNFLNFCRIKYRPIIVQNLKDVFKSWRLLIENGARAIHPSHGKSFDAEKLVQNFGHLCLSQGHSTTNYI